MAGFLVSLLKFPRTQRASALPVVLACMALGTSSAWADPSDATLESNDADFAIQAKPLDQWTGLWTRSTLFGDIGGLRSALGRHGITLDMQETSEVLGNVRGGIARGATYDGLTQLTLGLDTQKAFGWEGGTFNASALQIHGRNLSQYYLGSLQTASGIEADDTTRLWELWYQQAWFNDRFDIKIGQQSIDQEFMVSQYSNTFINTMFGWPGVPSYDMPSGGPAYPLAALGVRVRAKLTPSLTALAGVFDGNPAGSGAGDPQKLDAHGTNFNLHDGALFIGELQYALNQPAEGEMDLGSGGGLPGTYKLGLWYNNERFADQRYDNAGLSLANPASSGTARQHAGDYSFYAVADQMIWRPDPDGPRSLGVFARAMVAPGNRNPISASVNGGVVLQAPFASRSNDSVGLGIGYIKVSSAASALDRDTAALNDGYYPVRSSETVLEATYRYQVTPWWTLQGDLQYTFNPGGGIVDPNDASHRIRNTMVLGVRTVVAF